MKRFEIIYEDSVYCGVSPSDWHAAPALGVQAVLFEHDNGMQEKLYGFDYYALDEGIVSGSNDLLPNAKIGTLVSDDKFRTLIAALENISEIWNR